MPRPANIITNLITAEVLLNDDPTTPTIKVSHPDSVFIMEVSHPNAPESTSSLLRSPYYTVQSNKNNNVAASHQSGLLNTAQPNGLISHLAGGHSLNTTPSSPNMIVNTQPLILADTENQNQSRPVGETTHNRGLTMEASHPNVPCDIPPSQIALCRQDTCLSNSSMEEFPHTAANQMRRSKDFLFPPHPGGRRRSIDRGVDNPIFTFGEEDLQKMRRRSRNGSMGNLQITSNGNLMLPPLRVDAEQTYSPLTPFLTPMEMDCLAVPDHASLCTRRQSWASMTSRDSLFSGGKWRLRPVPNPSISDTISDPRTPLHSPGFTTGWSDSFFSPKKSKDGDNLSILSTSNSLSNVSSNLSERFRELYRAFSSRTQRFKEKTTQPPTPSSSLDDKSALSIFDGDDEPPQQRHRLDSFIPSDSRMSDDLSEVDKEDMWVEVGGCKMRRPHCCRKFRFPSSLDPQGKIYLFWLFIMTLAFLYNVWTIPLRGVFPYQTKENLMYWLICDYTCDLLYIIDIVIFKVRVRFINNGLQETNRKLTRKHYLSKVMFKMDVLCLMPLDLLYLLVGFNPWLRFPRFLKFQTFREFYNRFDQAAKSGHVIRVIKTMTYMLYLIHIETCGYYAVSKMEGIGSNKWVYNGQGNAYIRCFYLATKTATSIGNNPKPTNITEFCFMTVYWLSGVFVFALLIGQIRDIFEAASYLKTNFRKQMDITIWYMKSINLPDSIQDRVRLWFNYNWEQQKTLDENSLVSSLPRKLQTDLAINVHYATLSKVQLFQDCDKNLLYDLVLNLKPVLNLPGDYICQKGEVGKEMYIVSKGQVEVVAGEYGEIVLATLHEGSVFGEISLLALSGGNRRTADVRCKGYTNLFTLSKADFEEAMRDYPDAQKLLKKRAKKLLMENAAKIEQEDHKMEAEEIIQSLKGTPKMVKTVIQIMNPESTVMQKIASFKKSTKSLAVTIPEESGEKNVKDKENRKRKEGRVESEDTGSQFSLSEIPDENGGDSLDEEDEVLVIEKYEQELKELIENDDQQEPVKTEEKSTNEAPPPSGKIKMEDMCDSKGSVDSGVQSSKTGSASQSTKSTSNKNSKESLNSDLDEKNNSNQDEKNSMTKVTADKTQEVKVTQQDVILTRADTSIREASTKSIRSTSRSVRSTGSVHELGNARSKLMANGTKLLGRGMYAPSTPELHTIPPENQITCAVEIHREKSVTPLSMLADDMVLARIGSVASLNSKNMDETTC